MMSEITTIGLSEAGDEKLDELIDLGVFAQKMDGYRFAVALALAQGVKAPEVIKRKPFLNIGSLDPDQKLKKAVEALLPEEVKLTTPHRLTERLADWGVSELYHEAKSGEIDFIRLFQMVEAKGD